MGSAAGASEGGSGGARKLPPTAYELKEGQEYVPLTYGETPTEFTIKAVVAGAILGMVTPTWVSRPG
jgi:hypothetical protein